jgi:hypothetical protein
LQFHIIDATSQRDAISSKTASNILPELHPGTHRCEACNALMSAILALSSRDLQRFQMTVGPDQAQLSAVEIRHFIAEWSLRRSYFIRAERARPQETL